MRISDIENMPDGKMKQRLLAQIEGQEKPDLSTVTSKAVRKKAKSPAINVGEELFWQQLQDAKLPGWERQYKFHPERGYRVDFCNPELKLIVEIEGGVFTGGAHGSISGALRDMEKYNAATMLGYRLLRFIPDQVTKEVTAIEMVKDYHHLHGLVTLAEWCSRQIGRYRDTGNTRAAIAKGRLPGARKVDMGGQAGPTWMVPASAQITPSPFDPYGSRREHTKEGLNL